MATTVQIFSRVEASINGSVLSLGSLTSPTVISVDGKVFDYTTTLAGTTAAELFNVTTDLADFDVLAVTSDTAIELEFIVADDEAGEVVFVVPVAAGVPFILGADNSRESSHVEGWGTVGTADNIEKITAYNAGSTTATVRIVAIT